MSDFKLDPDKRIVVRRAKPSDILEISELSRVVYENGGEPGYSRQMIRGHINNFPEGQFVVTYGDQIVGYSACILVGEKKAFQNHTWQEISGSGFGSTHNHDGDWLYGIDVFVDSQFRGMRIGDRLYKQRKQLAFEMKLKGIVFAGRLPLLRKRISKIGSVENYIDAVVHKKVRDPVLGFQLRQGFEVDGILPGYNASDIDSLGYAVRLCWRNSSSILNTGTPAKSTKSIPSSMSSKVRIATVQYKQRGIKSFDEFKEIVEYFVDVVADYKSDFIVLPEFVTLQLLSLEKEIVPPHESIDALTKYTDQLKEMFRDLAVKYNVNIIGGSHPTKTDHNRVQNICYVYLRNGEIHEQAKIHPTPNESYWWNIEGGNEVNAIDTDCGPIGVMICYDSEFPELARHLVDQGALMLFVPFCTDERQSYLRVRYASQARAVENQCYVTLSGNVGNLPRVQNMDIQYAQSCILTPCDFGFARDGIAADTTPNVETVAFADLDLSALINARQHGTVRNLANRRHDLYSIKWKDDSNRPG